MNRLEDKTWRSNLLPEIFESIERGKRHKKGDHTEGTVPYVSSTEENNGVDAFIERVNGNRCFKDCISLANSGSVGVAFYEPFKYVASDHVTSLCREEATKTQNIFLAASIMKQRTNFDFNREINNSRVKKIQIMLPVDNDGTPDYDFMESYVSEKWGGLIMRYKSFLKKQLKELEFLEIPALEEKEWKPFRLSEIAECTNSTAYHSENLNFDEASKLTYVTRTANQNGIYGFVEEEAIFNINPANSISFGAETAEFFYRPSEYITGNKMYYITFQQLNVFTGHFFITCLRKSLKDCFSYGNGAIPSRVIRKPVMLPTSTTGEPDWEYMEQYAKNMMLKKYQQYLEFLGRQSVQHTITSPLSILSTLCVTKSHQ